MCVDDLFYAHCSLLFEEVHQIRTILLSIYNHCLCKGFPFFYKGCKHVAVTAVTLFHVRLRMTVHWWVVQLSLCAILWKIKNIYRTEENGTNVNGIIKVPVQNDGQSCRRSIFASFFVNLQAFTMWKLPSKTLKLIYSSIIKRNTWQINVIYTYINAKHQYSTLVWQYAEKGVYMLYSSVLLTTNLYPKCSL